MAWSVVFANRVAKQVRRLPKLIQEVLLLLVRDLEVHGPTTSGTWKSYGKLKGSRWDLRHCHLVKGRPTYVCCWEVKNKQLKIMEIYYAGTHEKAPY